MTLMTVMTGNGRRLPQDAMLLADLTAALVEDEGGAEPTTASAP